MPPPRTLPAALAVAAVVLAGCGTTYSQLNGNRYFRTAIDTYPVQIVSIDGKDQIRNPTYVDPGRRAVTVEAPPGGAFRYGERETITLDVKPCTRYWLVAVKPNRLSNEFTVKVDHEEAMAGCTPPA